MIDLHCHTTASDGVVSPFEIMKKAAREKVLVIGIADHDTVDGLDEAAQAAKEEGITFIPAIELSVAYPKGYFHLLGYGIQYENRALREKLGKMKKVREERVLRMVERLNETGIPITPEDVQRELTGSAPGKPHVARALMRKGYAHDVYTAMKSFLNLGRPGYVPKENIKLEEAFELIRSVGGLPVLAHPKSLRVVENKEYDQLMHALINEGLAGIEVYASVHDEDDVKIFNKLAERYGLIATGGSDFHGDNGGRLGYYGGGRPIPESCSQSLLQSLNALTK